MKKIICLIGFICLLSQVAFSQPAFTSYGEIKISQSPADDSPPSIAVNKDGAVWVVWGNAVQWFYPDMTFNGQNNQIIKRGMLPVALENGMWAVIRDTIVNSYYHFYRYYLYDTKSFVDTTIPIISFMNYSTPINWYRTDIISARHENYRGKVSIHAIIQWSSYDTDGPMWGASGGYYIWEWDYSSLKSVRTAYFDWYRLWNFGGMGNGYTDSFFKKSLEWRVDSKTKNNVYYVYNRDYLNDSTYSQAILIVNSDNQSIINTIRLDSVRMSHINLTHDMIAGTNDIVFLLSLKYPSDSLGVVAINVRTGQIDNWKYLINLVKRNQLSQWWIHGNEDYGLRSTADYKVESLQDGTYILISTQVQSDNTSDIYIVKLNQNFKIVGLPKRINSDTTGNQYSPSVGVKGDTVYVAWLDTRNGERHVYMRRFQADQITDVKKEEIQPKQFAIQEIFPNPFHESTMITFSLSRWERVGVMVFDLFGREVKTLFEGETESGSHSVQFDANGLPNGVYQVVLQSGSKMEKRNIVLLK